MKKELTELEIAESIPDLWQPLTQEQKEILAKDFTIQKYKKNENIYCEGGNAHLPHVPAERKSKDLQRRCGRT